MPKKRIKGVSGSRFPNMKAAVTVGSGEKYAIRRKRYLGNPFGMFLDLVENFPTGEVKYLNQLGGTPNRNQGLIR